MSSPARLALLVAALVAVLGALTAPAAHAQATAVPDSSFPDPNLRAWIKNLAGVPQSQQLTTAHLTRTSLNGGRNTGGPISDLTGLELFTRLAQISIPAPESGGRNTYSDLTPLAGRALTRVTFSDSQVRDFSKIAGSSATLTHVNAIGNGITDADLATLPALPKVTLLNLSSNDITDPSKLPSLPIATQVYLQDNEISDITKLPSMPLVRTLQLGDNKIADVSGLPSLPALTGLLLSGNQIVDVSPLASKLDGTKVNQLHLQRNRIVDASPLKPLGMGTNPLGNWPYGDYSLMLTGNRIADFSAFSDWTKQLAPESMDGQTIYTGSAYEPGGFTKILKSSVPGSVPALATGVEGTYDPETGKLLLTGADPLEQVPVGPHWTIRFGTVPETPDPSLPTITGTPRVGQVLTAVDGSWLDGRPCASSPRYQWFRDGVAIVRTPYLDGKTPTRPSGPYAPVVGDGGDFKTYMVQPRDAGHRLSVRVQCGATPAAARSAQTGLVDIDAAAPLTPTLQPLEGGVTLAATGYVTPHPRSYVVGDRTPTRVPFVLRALDAEGELVPADQLTVTVDPGAIVPDDPDDVLPYYSVFEPGDFEVEGAGYERTLVLRATRPGMQEGIKIRVTAPTGQSQTLALDLWVSGKTTDTRSALLGSTDPSTAIDVGDGHVLLADDEQREILLYDVRTTGREKAALRVDSRVNDESEIDWESSARQGDTVFWLGSHGNDSGGDLSQGRHLLAASTLTGTGANAKLAPKGSNYRKLREDLVAWDRAHGDRFGFLAGTEASPGDPSPMPEMPNGFNIEAAEFSPDGSELYLGFRSPVYPAVTGGDALIVPVKNVAELVAAPSGEDTRKAQFGEPIIIDLDGQSIREIRKNAAGEYLIVAGQTYGLSNSADQQTLWVWDGKRSTKPLRLGGRPPAELGSVSTGGFWEGIGALPAAFAPGAELGLLLDQGGSYLYEYKLENKKTASRWAAKSQHEVVSLTRTVDAQFAKSDLGTFAAQPANTVGAPRTVTITNDSFTPLNRVDLTKVKVVGADRSSRNEFLVSLDDCTGAELEQAESCDISVRYAPSRTNATSTAQLEISGNIPGGKTLIPLTGTSTDLPKGEDGADGPAGPKGEDGAAGEDGKDGTDGQTGPKGDAGPQGLPGADGAKGDTGARGAAGADGAAGANGRDGAAGPQGPAGPVSVSSDSSSSRSPTITVDSKGRLVVTVRNASKKALRLKVVARATIGGRKVTLAARTITVEAGKSRKVTLAVSKAARRKLGRTARPLEVTATPQTGEKAILRAKIKR